MQVAIACPSCNTPSSIDVPAILVQKSTRGIVSINVPADSVCKHNFQFFLDRNGSVRGYQKIDFQLELKSSEDHVTEFQCKLCHVAMSFRIDDNTSYLQKKVLEKYFGMQLATFQVAHMAGNEMHINSIMADETGSFKGFVEAYPVPLSEFAFAGKETYEENRFQKIPEGNVPLMNHSFLEILYLMDIRSLQILELIDPSILNIEEIAKIVLKKVGEFQKIYGDKFASTQLTIADKKFNIWIFKDNILFAGFKNALYIDRFEPIARKFVEQPFYDLVVKIEQVKTAFRFLERPGISSKDVATFFRLISDDRLFSTIQVRFPENIPRILKRLNEEFKIDSEVLEPFLYGKVSMSDLLGPELITKTSELFELIDFINRRNLLI